MYCINIIRVIILTLFINPIFASGFVGTHSYTPSPPTATPFNNKDQTITTSIDFITEWSTPESTPIANGGYNSSGGYEATEDGVTLLLTPAFGTLIRAEKRFQDVSALLDFRITTRESLSNGASDTRASSRLTSYQPIGNFLTGERLTVKRAEGTFARPIDLNAKVGLSKDLILSEAHTFALRSHAGLSIKHLRRRGITTYYKTTTSGYDDRYKITQKEVHIGAGTFGSIEVMSYSTPFLLSNTTTTALHGTSVQNSSIQVFLDAENSTETIVLNQKKNSMKMLPTIMNEMRLIYTPPGSNWSLEISEYITYQPASTHLFTNVGGITSQPIIAAAVTGGLKVSY